ncbi:hypothetical protein RRG08_004901 [Elysia crispata]|uniref:Uncharacterized protein n=1 Tax=Elysia crispata TaxID=231223 RepID=A0AAE1DGB8_9GAST|nr:hypothetical protein RRG08_004901 [Elysia crispata]
MFTEAPPPEDTSGTGTSPAAIVPVLSEELFHVLHVAIGVTGVFLVGSIAIPVNVANISVFWIMGLSDLSNLKFFVLSTVDFVTSTLILLTPFMSPPLNNMKGSLGSTFSTVIELFASPFLYAVLACGAWITAIITVERCLCVLLPLKGEAANFTIDQYNQLGSPYIYL